MTDIIKHRGIAVSYTHLDVYKRQDIFFVSMARSMGIPARIDEVTGKVQLMGDEGDVYKRQTIRCCCLPQSGWAE